MRDILGYTFATIAGVCFAGGILNSKRKRHIVGGILISMSTLFAGLAVTVMSIKEDDDE